jgi:hypothetical protein
MDEIGEKFYMFSPIQVMMSIINRGYLIVWRNPSTPQNEVAQD